MASNSFKSIKNGGGAIIVANDLASGRTVYLDETSRWTGRRADALVIKSDEDAHRQLGVAQLFVASNDVLDPYLVDTDQQGEALHVREFIRQHGPTIDAIPVNWQPPAHGQE